MPTAHSRTSPPRPTNQPCEPKLLSAEDSCHTFGALFVLLLRAVAKVGSHRCGVARALQSCPAHMSSFRVSPLVVHQVTSTMEASLVACTRSSKSTSSLGICTPFPALCLKQMWPMHSTRYCDASAAYVGLIVSSSFLLCLHLMNLLDDVVDLVLLVSHVNLLPVHVLHQKVCSFSCRLSIFDSFSLQALQFLAERLQYLLLSAQCWTNSICFRSSVKPLVLYGLEVVIAVATLFTLLFFILRHIRDRVLMFVIFAPASPSCSSCAFPRCGYLFLLYLSIEPCIVLQCVSSYFHSLSFPQLLGP